MAFLAAVPLIEGLSLGLGAVGTVVQAMGAMQAGQAAKRSAQYNAQVSEQNAQQADRNATLVAQAGAERAAIQSQKSKATLGGIIANEAAGNIDTTTGSALDVQTSQHVIGINDTLTIQSDAARQAYGYQTQAQNFREQAGVQRTEGANAATAGEWNAASTFLGGAGSAANKYANYQLAKGVGSDSSTSTGSDYLDSQFYMGGP